MPGAATRRMIVLAAVLILIAAALAAGGCGGSSVDAAAIITKSQQSMADINTAKMKMTMSSGGAGQMMNGTFDIEEAKGPNGPKLKMTGSVAGQTIEMYVSGSTAYMQVMGQWMKMDMPQGTSSATGMGLGSLEDIEKSMVGAKGAKVVSEDSDYYIIKYEMDSETVKQMMQSSQQGLSQSGLSPSDLGKMGIEMTIKVAKASNLVSEVDMKMSGSVGPMGSFDTDVKMTLVEYNGSVNVDPPPAALKAQPMTIPNMPNLNL